MPLQPAAPVSPAMVTRGRAHAKDKTLPPNDHRSVSLDLTLGSEIPSTSHSYIDSSSDNYDCGSQQGERDAIADIHPREAASRHNAPVDILSQQAADPLLNVNKPALPAQLIGVNKTSLWASWTHPDNATSSSQFRPHPVLGAPSFRYDPDDVGQEVHNILATTASTLLQGNIRQGHTHTRLNMC